MNRAAVLVTLMLVIAGCGPAFTGVAPAAYRPADPLSIRYRDQRSRRQAHGPSRPAGQGTPLGATWAYRNLVAPTLGARCRLIPSDSEYVDRRARVCAGSTAAVWGVARVMLEVGASPALFPTTVSDGQLKFVDLPPAPGTCGR